MKNERARQGPVMASHDYCLVTRATVKRRGPWISVTGPWHILTYAFIAVAGFKNLKTLVTDILWPQFRCVVHLYL